MSYSLADPSISGQVYFEIVYKDPDSKIPVTINWELVMPSGDDVTTVEAVAYDWGTDTISTELLVHSNSNTAKTSTHVIKGGLVGAYYDLRITANLNYPGYIYERTVLVCMVER
jgi:hypothetical protein